MINDRRKIGELLSEMNVYPLNKTLKDYHGQNQSTGNVGKWIRSYLGINGIKISTVGGVEKSEKWILKILFSNTLHLDIFEAVNKNEVLALI